jgi:RNA polymerase sigma-70 factor, ECF subfamily
MTAGTSRLAHPSSAPLPDDVAAARERMGQLKLALEQLSAEQRVVLSLFAVEGLGHEEIAGVLGVPTGTVWSRLHSARKRLAGLM